MSDFICPEEIQGDLGESKLYYRVIKTANRKYCLETLARVSVPGFGNTPFFCVLETETAYQRVVMRAMRVSGADDCFRLSGVDDPISMYVYEDAWEAAQSAVSEVRGQQVALLSEMNALYDELFGVFDLANKVVEMEKGIVHKEAK